MLNFKVYIPVKIIFDDESLVRFRILVDKKEKLFTLPPLPLEPDEIIFNDMESVLCEVDYDSWD